MWFLSSMNQLMVFKISIVYKCPITMMTLIWSLTRVNPHVANILPCMYPRVPCKKLIMCKNLVTLVAFKWSFPSVYVRNTDTCIRVFPQRQHWHGVASACISICHLRLTTCEKDLSHLLHLCTFFPV